MEDAVWGLRDLEGTKSEGDDVAKEDNGLGESIGDTIETSQ